MPQSGLEGMLRVILTIRKFERKLLQLRKLGRLPPYRLLLSIGEEIAAEGICSALSGGDQVVSSHRCHGHYIAKGGDPNKLMAEMFGKAGGTNCGKGGTLHISDPSIGFLSAIGIVGAGIPIATGAGLTAKLRGSGKVTACFFGDAAAEGGAFHEGLNLASSLQVPVIFVCENNSPRTDFQVADTVARQYHIPSSSVEGDDLVGVRRVAGEAVAQVRMGGGPRFVECRTTAMSEEELLKAALPDDGQWIRGIAEKAGLTLDNNSILSMTTRTDREIESAVKFAEESQWPTKEDTFNDVLG